MQAEHAELIVRLSKLAAELTEKLDEANEALRLAAEESKATLVNLEMVKGNIEVTIRQAYEKGYVDGANGAPERRDTVGMLIDEEA